MTLDFSWVRISKHTFETEADSKPCLLIAENYYLPINSRTKDGMKRLIKKNSTSAKNISSFFFMVGLKERVLYIQQFDKW